MCYKFLFKYYSDYLAGEKLAGEKGTPGLLLGPVNLFKGPAFSGVSCLLLEAGICCEKDCYIKAVKAIYLGFLTFEYTSKVAVIRKNHIIMSTIFSIQCMEKQVW